jgi:aminoglycoside phosphotransferase family enzyme/predicted kinase
MSDSPTVTHAVVGALEDPRFYPHGPAHVEHLQTHISHVFLADPYVYKLKKAVRFPFLDFSTPAQREHFCREEVRLNDRLCPSVYLDVIPITRDAGGRLTLGGHGEVLEHVVWMRRLPAERMLMHLVARDRVTRGMIEALAAKLAAFHAGAPSGPEIAMHADPDRLAARWMENIRGAEAFAGTLLAPEDHAVLADFGPTFVRTHETLLRARQQAGRIREGHGDLHAEHVCFIDAPVPAGGDRGPLPPGIYVFDCIEFSQPLRCNDVAYEIAFLAMDLERLERPDLARHLIAAYATAADDPLVSTLLPFYGGHLACVRGKVEGLESIAPDVDAADRAAAEALARRHFALAVRYAWQAAGPAVIACGGLSGSGKSTLAAELATRMGFVLLATDAIRRRAAGATGSRAAAYGNGLYSAAAREAVYETLCVEADAALAAGHGVIADATFIREADRRRLATVARRHRLPCAFVECRAREDVIRRRLEVRDEQPSLSDARWDTYVGQRAQFEAFKESEPHVVVDTSASAEVARATAVRQLWQWRHGHPLGLSG